MINHKKLLLITTLFALIASLPIIGYTDRNAKMDNTPNLKGQLIYSNDKNIVSFNLETKSEQIIYSTKGTPDGVYCFDIAPDNKKIIASLIHVINGDRLSLINIIKIKDRVETFLEEENRPKYRGLSWSPDGRQIAIVRGARDNIAVYKLHTVNDDGPEIKKISDVNLYAYKPTWSPDSKKIAVTGFDSMKWTQKKEEISKKGLAAMGLNIYIVDVNSGSTQKIIETGYGPSWSPDGNYIAYYEPVLYSNKANLKVFDINNKTSLYLIKKKGFRSSPVWSSDGKYLLYTRIKNSLAPTERQVIEAYSLEEKRSFELLENGRIHNFVLKQGP